MNGNRITALALFLLVSGCSSGLESSVPLRPQAQAVPALGSKNNQYRYGGCGVFPNGDIFNHASGGYYRDPDTAQMFAGAPQGNFAYWDDQADERVNLTTSTSATWYTAQGVPGGHNPPLENATSWPWTNGMFIEPGDSHAIVLLTDTCQEYEAYGSQWTAANGPFALYGGRTNNFSQTWASQLVNGESAVTQAGIPLLPTTYWGEDAGGQRINHMGSILLVAGYCLSQYGWAYPATSPGYVADTQKCTHPIHMGDLFKLRDTFNCQPYVAAVAALCRSMKHFPLVVDDELSTDSNEPWALRFGLTAAGQKAWPYYGNGALQQFLTALTPSANTWMHVEPPGYTIECLPGHTYGVDCW
jgi:hypothetical protein